MRLSNKRKIEFKERAKSEKIPQLAKEYGISHSCAYDIAKNYIREKREYEYPLEKHSDDCLRRYRRMLRISYNNLFDSFGYLQDMNRERELNKKERQVIRELRRRFKNIKGAF